MAILDEVLANFYSSGGDISGQIANEDFNPATGVIFSDLIDVNSAVTGVSLSLNVVPATNANTVAPTGGTTTENEINAQGWYADVLASNVYQVTLDFPAAHGPVDIDVFNSLDNFTGQDTMSVDAIGLTTVSQTLGPGGIGSDNLTQGGFFTLLNVTPDGSDQIILDLINTGGGTFFNLNGVRITPAAAAAPIIVTPTSSNTDTTITPSFSTDVTSGTGYSVAVATGAGAPTVAQVIAGTDSLDAAAPNSNATVTGSPQGLPAITALSPSTGYDIYIAQNAAGGDSNLLSIINVVTDASTTQTTFPMVTSSDLVTFTPVADEEYTYQIFDARHGTKEGAQGTFTPVTGVATITGLSLATGVHFIDYFKTSNVSVGVGHPITVT